MKVIRYNGKWSAALYCWECHVSGEEVDMFNIVFGTNRRQQIYLCFDCITKLCETAKTAEVQDKLSFEEE